MTTWAGKTGEDEFTVSSNSNSELKDAKMESGGIQVTKYCQEFTQCTMKLNREGAKQVYEGLKEEFEPDSS